MAFREGDRVEVASKEEGFVGSYYRANIITALLNGSDYVVEYKTLVKDDDSSEPLREIVGSDEVRPVPPRVRASGGEFRVNDWVDVYANDGWWVGVVSGKKPGKPDSYYVYFETTREEILYPVTDLRVHQDWCKGKWIVPKF